ncbi:MAG: hypothetical protein H0Z24_06850 [Thermosipho sp. (in: Bacteria)]|nr:hypothetical protein [Thermosipho sp. (in: thermotogales)]
MKPQRTFTADEGDFSTGLAGPDQIEKDLDTINKMFDPLATHDNNEQGGIGTENIQDNAITDDKIGNRTVDQTISTTFSNTGKLTTLLSFFAKVLKNIIGKTNWYDTPTKSLEQLNTDINDLAGTGRTVETVKQNADDITGLAQDIITLDTNKADKTALETHKTSNDHDNRYYTKTEIENKLSQTAGGQAYSFRSGTSFPSSPVEGDVFLLTADYILNGKTYKGGVSYQYINGEWVEFVNGKENYSPELTQNSSVFSLGTGKDENGQDVDVSSSVVNGQVSVIVKGQTIFQHANNGDNYENWVVNTESSVNNNAIHLVKGSEGNYADLDLNLQPNTQYTLVYNIKDTDTDGTLMVGGYLTGTAFSVDQTIGQHRVTFTTQETIDTNRLRFFISGGTIGTYVDITDVMILEGDWTTGELADVEVGELKYGVNSTNNVRVKVVGKNLADTIDTNKWEQGVYGLLGESLSTDQWLRTKSSVKFKCIPNQNVKVSINSGYAFRVLVYDSNDNFLYSTGDSTSASFITDSNAAYFRYCVRFNPAQSITLDELQNIELQVEYGTTATSYEPYKESIRYITLPDGVDSLDSLPNGTKDEVTDDGKLIKRTKKTTMQGTDVTNFDTTTLTNYDIVRIPVYENMSQEWGNNVILQTTDGRVINKYRPSSTWEDVINAWTYYYYNNEFRILVPANYFADLAAVQSYFDEATLIYQLATPEEYQLEGFTPLNSFEKGTVYVEPYYKKEHTYNSTNGGLQFDEALKEIEKVVDKNGNEVDLSNVTLASDGLSATITGASDNDVYIVYGYPQEGVIPETKHKVPLNTSATIKDNNAMINQLSKEFQDYMYKTDAYLLNIEARLTANGI